jgi:hypothetical protein
MDGERLMIEGAQPIVETVIMPEPEESVQPPERPMEQVAEAIAAELTKELDILPASVAQPPAEILRASVVVATPLAEESVS